MNDDGQYGGENGCLYCLMLTFIPPSLFSFCVEQWAQMCAATYKYLLGLSQYQLQMVVCQLRKSELRCQLLLLQQKPLHESLAGLGKELEKAELKLKVAELRMQRMGQGLRKRHFLTLQQQQQLEEQQQQLDEQQQQLDARFTSNIEEQGDKASMPDKNPPAPSSLPYCSDVENPFNYHAEAECEESDNNSGNSSTGKHFF